MYFVWKNILRSEKFSGGRKIHLNFKMYICIYVLDLAKCMYLVWQNVLGLAKCTDVLWLENVLGLKKGE